MKGRTLDQGRALVALFKAHFFTRTDKVAAKMPWGKPHPIEGGDNFDGLLLAHVLGEGGPKGKARYGNRKGSTKVEAGYYRIGSYTPDEEGLTRWLCLDFDGGAEHADSLADPQGAVISAHRACTDLSLPSYVERSGGGKGFHLWVLFAEPVPAKDARRLGMAIAPKDAPLVAGSCADARRACGIEVFPKQDKIKKKSGYGNLVWLPWWSEAPDGANEFHRLEGNGLVPFTPETFETVTAQRLAETLGSLPGQTDGHSVTPDDPTPDTVTVTASPDETDPDVQAYLKSVGDEKAGQTTAPASWTSWREKALASLPLESVYGPWLTGAKSGESWFECRDPDSPSGDQNPSSGVADGTGDATRGTFHSFRTGDNTSVFDFMLRHGLAASFGEALKKVAEYSGVPLPEGSAGSSSTSASASPLKLSKKLLPEIIVNNRQFRDVVTDAWSALHAANKPPSLFVRMGGLIRVAENFVEDRLVRQIETVSEMALYDRLARTADWVKIGEDSVASVNPPKDVARVMAAVPDAKLPPLAALAEGPVFARDGSLIASPGYHREAALWLDLPEGFSIGDIPDAPSTADISWARSLLVDDLFTDFPFVAPSDRAHAVAAVILPFVRRLIPGRTPIHLVEAPAEGSGKGYICHAVSIIASGQTQGARTLSHDDDEARKMITSELSTGRPIILLDNADDRKLLSSPSLASVITADTWTDRQLGQSRMLTMPNNAVWLLTGNNPKLSMELARRCVRIRIEPPEERPHLRRSFKHDPFLDWVRENRADLVRAVLILVRHWIASGKPLSSHRLGSFERWAQIIGSILELSGIPGFLGNLEALYEAADVEGESWREFVSTWWDEHGEVPKKVSDLNALCESHDLMVAIRGDGSAKSQQTRLGHALLSKRDRVYGKLQIVRVGRNGHDKVTRYGLHEIDRHPGDPKPGKTQQDLFAECGTLDSMRHLENEVPQQGAAQEKSVETDSYEGLRHLRAPFSDPNAREEDNSCACTHARIIGTRAGVKTHMGGGTERYPQVPHFSGTAGNHNEISRGTFDGKVPQNLAEPPWDDPEPDPGDIDLASFEDDLEVDG